MNNPKKHESKRVKSDKARAKLKPARTKQKVEQNISNLPVLVDQLVGPLLERGLQQRVVQPRVGLQTEVEEHRLAKQQVKRPEPRAVHQLVRLVLVTLPKYLLRAGLSEPEPCGAAMEATEIMRNLLARV